MLLSAGSAISALQGSVYQAARKQLRVAERHMAALYRRKIAAAHLDRLPAPVLSEVASGCTELCMEERHRSFCLSADALLQCKDKPALLPAVSIVSFDSTTGVAVVKLASIGIEPVIEAGLCTLVRFRPSLRAITLHIARPNQVGQSSRTVDRERRALEALQGLSVPIVREAAGNVGGVSFDPDYCVAGPSANVQAGRYASTGSEGGTSAKVRAMSLDKSWRPVELKWRRRG